MDNSNNGYLIMLRYVMRLLLDECKGSGKASELEVYSYLFYHANFSLFPEKVRKGEFFVTANKGQIAISSEDLAQYFGIARNTINRRLNALIKKGIITKNKNSNVCNVYEIVSFGETKFMIEQPQNVDTYSDLNENSNAVEQPKAIFEQPIEQPIEQPKTQIVEQPQNVDISNENGNFSKDIEQPQNVAKNSTSGGNVEQPYLINSNKINNNNLIPTTICLHANTREKNFLDSVRDDEKFIPQIQKELNIERDDIESKFDNFYEEQLEQNKQYNNTDDVKWHFSKWFEKILKQCYGTEIFDTFKDFSTQPKRLLYPLRMLSKKQKAEFAMLFNLDESQFDLKLNEYLKTANEYRFKSFTEELQKLQFYVNNSDLQF